MSNATISVRDITTKEEFKLEPYENTAYVKTRDGARVKLHPCVIQTMVKRGGRFDGQTIKGPRRMERI